MTIFCDVKRCPWNGYIQRFNERVCTKSYIAITIDKNGRLEATPCLKKAEEVNNDTKL